MCRSIPLLIDYETQSVRLIEFVEGDIDFWHSIYVYFMVYIWETCKIYISYEKVFLQILIPIEVYRGKIIVNILLV